MEPSSRATLQRETTISLSAPAEASPSRRQLAPPLSAASDDEDLDDRPFGGTRAQDYHQWVREQSAAVRALVPALDMGGVPRRGADGAALGHAVDPFAPLSGSTRAWTDVQSDEASGRQGPPSARSSRVLTDPRTVPAPPAPYAAKLSGRSGYSAGDDTGRSQRSGSLTGTPPHPGDHASAVSNSGGQNRHSWGAEALHVSSRASAGAQSLPPPHPFTVYLHHQAPAAGVAGGGPMPPYASTVPSSSRGAGVPSLLAVATDSPSSVAELPSPRRRAAPMSPHHAASAGRSPASMSWAPLGGAPAVSSPAVRSPAPSHAVVTLRGDGTTHSELVGAPPHESNAAGSVPVLALPPTQRNLPHGSTDGDSGSGIVGVLSRTPSIRWGGGGGTSERSERESGGGTTRRSGWEADGRSMGMPATTHDGDPQSAVAAILAGMLGEEVAERAVFASNTSLMSPVGFKRVPCD